MRALKTIIFLTLFSLSTFAKVHCPDCDTQKSLCICLIPEYVGIFHWDYDTAMFDISFDINGNKHHYGSRRELHKDVLDSIDFSLIKDAKISNVHYELETINFKETENCVIDVAKPKTGIYLVTITKQSDKFVCDIKFES